MSTNISKKKRDDLLDKIKQIRAFIAAAPQDENTGNLLAYLSELEKDVNGKKYGLVFEEHREEIDEVLDTHTPVLTEEADLFIDHGGQMNFLLEGDMMNQHKRCISECRVEILQSPLDILSYRAYSAVLPSSGGRFFCVLIEKLRNFSKTPCQTAPLIQSK